MLGKFNQKSEQMRKSCLNRLSSFAAFAQSRDSKQSKPWKILSQSPFGFGGVLRTLLSRSKINRERREVSIAFRLCGVLRFRAVMGCFPIGCDSISAGAVFKTL